MPALPLIVLIVERVAVAVRAITGQDGISSQ